MSDFPIGMLGLSGDEELDRALMDRLRDAMLRLGERDLVLIPEATFNDLMKRTGGTSGPAVGVAVYKRREGL